MYSSIERKEDMEKKIKNEEKEREGEGDVDYICRESARIYYDCDFYMIIL